MSTKRNKIRDRMSALPDVFQSGVKEAISVFAGKKDLADAAETVMQDSDAAEQAAAGTRRIPEQGKRRKKRIS